MTIALKYGRAGLQVAVPPQLQPQLLHLHPLPQLEDPQAALQSALRHPIGTVSLQDLAIGRETACIVVSDVTRPVPNSLLLSGLLAELHSAGIQAQNIKILIATGLHRPNLGEELEEVVGPHIVGNYEVINHVARNLSEMTDLGEVDFLGGMSATAAVNTHYAEADLKITTGLIEPHFMAGYSGGRKLICPGIASAPTILQFHAPGMIGHPGSTAGNLEGNPIHAMSRAVAGLVGCDFICNVTLSESRAITGIFCGDLDLAHQAGIQHVKRGTEVEVVPAPIVLTTGAGYPLDTTFYQCIKGMVCALPALEKGGTLILVSSLTEGVGGEEFTSMAQTLISPQEFLERIQNSPVTIDQWQIQEMMKVLLHAGRVIVVSDGIPESTLKQFLVDWAPTAEAALQWALERHGPGHVVIIPEGPYVTPVPVPTH